ncbi:MAG: PhzF family phenazine biosynthesis protein [Sedimentisphaerales bacterium]|nr:PhzF family phenazine biosynthesis protein [Sedimentisphaerales bacterium]
MSKGRIFYIVDVFAEEKYAGNQLAVIRDAAGLSDDDMQNITKEMNYSETTFVLSDDRRNGGYDVRIFTPAEEVPFAGHPTLGTAYIIQQEIIKEPVEKIILNLKVGQIPVTFNYSGKEKDVLRMKQIEPAFAQTIEPEQISQVLGINTSDIDEKFPVQEVSTGMFFIIVPLKTLDAVKRAKVARDKYFKLIENRQAKAILVFCPETYSKKNDLNVRVFVDYYGIPEDPATGSGNGCLAGYLVKNRYFGKEQIDIRVEQGYEIARPSLLYLKAENKDGQIDISVGGKVVMVARGELI